MICCVRSRVIVLIVRRSEWMGFGHRRRREVSFLGALYSNVMACIPALFIVELVFVAIDDNSAIFSREIGLKFIGNG